jgi:hypothetical protein
MEHGPSRGLLKSAGMPEIPEWGFPRHDARKNVAVGCNTQTSATALTAQRFQVVVFRCEHLGAAD